MKLFDYLKNKQTYSAKWLSDLRDSAALAKRSIFQELYKAPSSAEYFMDFDSLAALAAEAAALDGENLQVLTETAGWKCDEMVYAAMGGYNEQLVRDFIPLVNNEEGKRFALTTCPDDEIFVERVTRAYKGADFDWAICSQAMWPAIYQLYVEPLLLGQVSYRLSAVLEKSTTISDKARDSEARKFYTTLLNAGITRRASDVHFKPKSDRASVLFRIDGHNYWYTDISLEVAERVGNLLITDGGISTENPHDPIDGKVRFSPSQGAVPGDEVDLRVSIIPTKSGADINVRYLSDKIYTFDELGLSASSVAQYKQLLDLPSGLVVQVGPTGSGKSTTLYAGLAYVYKSLRNIISIEDPVEISMEEISQVDVRAEGKSGLTFSKALKACLRHDPDVIVVGELRDEATAFEAVRAANTGHLVLTSLHTNDSIGTFERLINLGIDPYSLGDVMAAVMSQRLVRRLCPYCKQPYTLNLKSDLARQYGFPNEEREVTIYKPHGCVKCNNTGYHGRTAINEVLRVDKGLRELIQRHAVRSYFEKYLKESHFKTMYQDGLERVLDGTTSLEEMSVYLHDPLAFKG